MIKYYDKHTNEVPKGEHFYSEEITDTFERVESTDGFWCEKIRDKDQNVIYYRESTGKSWNRTYNENGQVLTHENGNGFKSERTYDEFGYQIAYSDNNGVSWKRTYSKDGTVLTHTDINGTYKPQFA